MLLGEALALCAHCVHTAHAEAEILTQVIRLVVTALFPRNPFQKMNNPKITCHAQLAMKHIIHKPIVNSLIPTDVCDNALSPVDCTKCVTMWEGQTS